MWTIADSEWQFGDAACKEWFHLIHLHNSLTTYDFGRVQEGKRNKKNFINFDV